MKVTQGEIRVIAAVCDAYTPGKAITSGTVRIPRFTPGEVVVCIEADMYASEHYTVVLRSDGTLAAANDSFMLTEEEWEEAEEIRRTKGRNGGTTK